MTTDLGELCPATLPILEEQANRKQEPGAGVASFWNALHGEAAYYYNFKLLLPATHSTYNMSLITEKDQTR